MKTRVSRRSLLKGAGIAVAASIVSPASVLAASSSPLRGIWHMSLSSNGIEYDSSTYHNNGAASGAVSATDGVGGGATRFSGGYVRVPSQASLEPAHLGLTMYLRGDPQQPFAHVLAKGASGCIAASFGVYTGRNAGLIFYVSNGFTYALSPDAGVRIWDGRWHLVRAMYDGQNVSLWIDGIAAGPSTPSNLIINYGLLDGRDLLFARYETGCVPNFTGDIDEIALYAI